MAQYDPKSTLDRGRDRSIVAFEKLRKASLKKLAGLGPLKCDPTLFRSLRKLSAIVIGRASRTLQIIEFRKFWDIGAH